MSQTTEQQETAAATTAGEKRWLDNARARCDEVTKELYGTKQVAPQYRHWQPETDVVEEITRADGNMEFDTEHGCWVNARPQVGI
jgi:hypothetical protein